jgi:hypothetical protein
MAIRDPALVNRAFAAMLAAMIDFDRMERRWGGLAFPGFLRFYALFHVLVFVLQWIRPDLGSVLEFDRGKILSGEVWRLVTMFFAVPQFGRPGLMSVIFLIIAVNVVFMIGDGLETAWGTFRASLFYYMGVLLILAGNFLYPSPVPFSGGLLYVSAFLAFATVFPKVQILLFFVLPVQVRVLGIVMGAGVAVELAKTPALAPLVGLALANWVVFAAAPALRGTARVVGAGERKRSFKPAKVPEDVAFHTCAVCGRTERTDPYLEFRIAADGVEYCLDDLPE